MSTQQPNNIPPVTQPEVDVTPADVTQVTTETPAVVETTQEVPTAEVQADATMNAEAQAAGVTPEQQAQGDEVVNAVATAIAEDRITARDILIAVLVDSSLGVTPAQAETLADLFAGDMLDDYLKSKQAQTTQTAPDTMQVDTTQQEPPVV